MLIQRHGEPAVEAMVRGWVENLATPPLLDDPSILEAIIAGRCDLGIANSYYLARFSAGRRSRAGPVLARSADAGVHSQHHRRWRRPSCTQPYAGARSAGVVVDPSAPGRPCRHEPGVSVNPKAYPPRIVAKWGSTGRMRATSEAASRFREQAVNLMERAGYR